MNAELVNIGNELLLGLVTNTHAVYLGRRLAELGFALERQVCVGDAAGQITAAVKEAAGRADVVITTGGLGPTSDDLTLSTLGELFGWKFRIDENALGQLQKWFESRKAPMPDLVKKQALVPAGTTVLYNGHGTAPGCIAEIPKSFGRARCLVVLPGPPRELKPMFEEGVVAYLSARFAPQQPVECRILRVADVGESTVQERVEAKVRERFPKIQIAYSARPGEVDLRFISEGEPGLVAEAETLARGILGKDVFGNGAQELEEVVVGLLRVRRATVATAESCTGGALANRFTNVPGASEVFLQGWITYSNEAKTQELGVSSASLERHGAVSEAVAREMAEGARKSCGAGYALSVTGIAGPDGGTADKPVGTVFIGLATPEGTRVYKEYYPLDRWTFKWRVAQRALNLLRLELMR